MESATGPLNGAVLSLAMEPFDYHCCYYRTTPGATGIIVSTVSSLVGAHINF